MNGGISGGGISLAFDYNEDCFRELMENDDYALYSVGTRKMKLADDFSMSIMPRLRIREMKSRNGPEETLPSFRTLSRAKNCTETIERFRVRLHFTKPSQYHGGIE